MDRRGLAGVGLSSWRGDEWVLGIAGEGGAKGVGGVAAVSADGVDVAADVEAVLGGDFAGEPTGDFVEFGRPQVGAH